MDRLNIILYMDLTENAPDGPGWYVAIASNVQNIVGPIAIPDSMVPHLASAFQAALDKSREELPEITMQQITESGSNLLRQAVETQIAEAERSVQRLAMLRRRLAEFPAKVQQ